MREAAPVGRGADACRGGARRPSISAPGSAAKPPSSDGHDAACAPCRDAACARRLPGRHSSPCRNRRRRAGRTAPRAERHRRRRNPCRLPARQGAMRCASVGLAPSRIVGRETRRVLGRDDGAPAERRQARIGDDERRRRRPARCAAPSRDHREASRRGPRSHLGAQLVEAEPLGEVGRMRTRRRRGEAAAGSCGAARTKKSNRILPCGVSSAAVARAARRVTWSMSLVMSPARKVSRVLAATRARRRGRGRSRDRHRCSGCSSCAVTSCPGRDRPQGAGAAWPRRGKELAMAADLRPRPEGRHRRQPGRWRRARRRRPGGRIAALGDLSARLGRRSRRLPRACTSCRASSTPRCISASRGWNTRKTWKPARRGAVLGRRHGRVRDAEHRAADDDARQRWPTRSARARGRMHCDFAFYVGGTHENAAEVAELERLPGCCRHQGVHGLLDRHLLVEDDAGLAEILAPHAPPRRLPFRGRDAAARAHAACASRRSALASGLARAGSGARVDPAPGAHRRADRRAHPRAARLDRARRWRSCARTRTSRRVEVTPQHLTLVAPDCYERLGTLRADEPAGARRRASRRRSGRASTRASPTSWAPTTRRTRARRRPGPIRPRLPA